MTHFLFNTISPAATRPRTTTMTRSRSLLFALLAMLALVPLVGVEPARADGFGGVVTQGAAPTMNGSECTGCECKPAKQASRQNGSVGDPIWTYDGSLHLSYTDLTVGRNFPIKVSRSYDSRSEYDSAIGYGWAFAFDRRLFEYPDGSIIVRSGCGSRSRFVNTGGAFVAPQGGVQGQLTALGNGSYELRYAGGNIDRFDADGRLSMIVSASGARHELIYDAGGRLPLIGTSPRSLDPNKPMLVAYQPRVTRIQERGADGALTGYYVDFTYNTATGRVTKVKANDDREVNYGFDVTGTGTRGNLISVTGLTDYAQIFAYVVSSTNPDQHNITSIIDGTDATPVTNKYNALDQVTEQVEATTVWTLAYPSAGTTTITEKVRNASGSTIQTRTRTQVYDAGGYLTKEIDALGNETRYLYDGNRDITRTELWELQGTTLVLLKAIDNTYNGQGQPLTESVTLDTVGGQPAEVVTTTWTYDHGWVASIQAVSNKSPQIFRTEYIFLRDAQSNPLSIAQVKRRKDDGSFVSTSFTYCTTTEASAANTVCPDTRLIKQIDGPRTDVNDVVTFTYYGTTDTTGCALTTGNCFRRGDRKQIINALSQAFTFLRYDAAGRATQVRDQNNVIAEMTYHPRGWLLKQIVRGPNDDVITDDQITDYKVDPRGNATKVTSPDGNTIELFYDSRDRLTETRDQSGKREVYTYDSAGNRQTLNAYSGAESSANRKRLQSYVVDMLDRMTQIQGSTADKLTTFTYDAADRQTKVIDPNLMETTQIYDDLDRLIATVADSASGGIQSTTGMAYDAAGNLRSVIDPKGLPTTYVYDALSRLIQQVSPDSGTTSFAYNDATGQQTRTDARGITSTFNYDALDRLTSVAYPAASENVTYLYDTTNAVCQADENFMVGRLSKMTDQSGTTEYCYDRFGNVTRKVQITGTLAHAVRYAYTKSNQLMRMTYPDGTLVDYTRDTQEQVREIGVTVPGGTRQVLIGNAAYLPGGPASSWQYGGSRTMTRTYDLDYRVTGVRDPGAGGLDIGYVYDSASYLTQITTQSTAAVRAKFEYDALGRLKARKNASDVDQERYTYDNTGNRLTAGELYTVPDPNGPPGGGGGTIDQFITSSYSYPTDSHRLTALGGEPRAYSANGNLTTIGDPNGPGGPVPGREYVYNDANRMSTAKASGSIVATYLYNGLGEQVQRQAGVTTRFVYDEAGQLLGQYDVNGTPIQQYVWLDGQPVGLIVPPLPQQEGQPAPLSRLWYVQSDALGSPRTIIDPARNLAVWRWDEMKEGFGDHAPQTDPDNDSTHVVFDLRFPGQRYDAASGLHYNYQRDFEPATGRYTQSDPLGLDADISLYAYVGNDPLSYIDPLGLFGWRDAAGFVPVLGSGLDAYDAFKCGNIGMGLLNLGLAALDLTGAGAIVKGIAVGTMKYAARRSIRQVYRSTTNWDDMRRGLQKIGQVARNSRSTPNRDWLTTDHIYRKQRYGLPHEKTNAPWNLQTNVPKWLNSEFEGMNKLQRAKYLPAWMKLGAGGVASTVTGWFVGSGTESGGNCGCN